MRLTQCWKKKSIEAMKWEEVNQDSRDFRGNSGPGGIPTTACGRATHTDAEWRHSAHMAPLCDSSRSSTCSLRRASRVVALWRVLEATIAPPCALHWVVTPGRKLFVVHREGEGDILVLITVCQDVRRHFFFLLLYFAAWAQLWFDDGRKNLLVKKTM